MEKQLLRIGEIVSIWGDNKYEVVCCRYPHHDIWTFRNMQTGRLIDYTSGEVVRKNGEDHEV